MRTVRLPIHRMLHPRLAVAIVFVGVLTGCGPNIECMDFTGSDECVRIAEAALPEVPPGASSLIVDAGVSSGIRTPPYPVVACYPDGTAVAIEVTMTAGSADASPWTGGQLPFECDR